MSCEVSVSSLSVQQDENQSVQQITVSGFATDCDRVYIALELQGLGTEEGEGSVAHGEWTIVLDIPRDRAPKCGNDYTLRVRCTRQSGATICEQTLSGQLCFELTCPEFGALTAEVSAECNSDGTRSVEISGAYSADTNFLATVDYGDGAPTEEQSWPSGIYPLLHRHDYQPGHYRFTIAVPGCDMHEVAVDVDDCPGTGGRCQISFGNPDVRERDCDQGRREVDIAIPYLGDGGNHAAEIDYGDGQREQVELTGDGQLQALALEHLYDTGQSYQARLTLPSPCEPLLIVIPPVTSCAAQCPQFGRPSIEELDCVDEHHRRVRVTVAYDAPQACQATISLGGGEARTVTLEAGEQRLLISEHVVDAGETMQGAIRIDCDALSCPEVPLYLKHVERCLPGGGPGDEPGGGSNNDDDDDDDDDDDEEVTGGGGGGRDGESNGCRLLRWVAVISGALAIVFAALYLCMPNPGSIVAAVAGGLAAIAAVALAWFLNSCPRPCGWALLVTWQSLLTGGLAALLFYPCCNILAIAGATAALAGLGAARAWMIRCHVTRCTMLAEILAMFAGALTPVITYIQGLPFQAIQQCMSSGVAIGIATLTTAVTLAVTSGCINRDG